MNEDMRQLPKFVEDRYMIGFMPASTFIKLFPIFAALGIFALYKFNPTRVAFSAGLIFTLYLLFTEISRKFTVFDYLKNVIRYKLEGVLYFERSCSNVPEEKRVSFISISEE